MINVFTLKKQKLKLQILIFCISLFNLKVLILTYINFFSTKVFSIKNKLFYKKKFRTNSMIVCTFEII